MPPSDGLPCIYDAMAEDHDAEYKQAPTNQDWKCRFCDDRASRWLEGHPICNLCFLEEQIYQGKIEDHNP